MLLDLIFLITSGEKQKQWGFLNPLTSNIPLSNLFSNTLNECSSLNVTDQVSHPYKTTGKITMLCILIVMSLDSRQEDSGC
jgi:hypothetical protein